MSYILDPILKISRSFLISGLSWTGCFGDSNSLESNKLLLVGQNGNDY